MLNATLHAPAFSRIELAERLKALRLTAKCSAQELHDKPRAPITALAELAGIDRKTIYTAMQPNAPLSMELQRSLSAIVQRIEAGELRFERRGQQWQSVFSEPQERQPHRLLHIELCANGPRLKTAIEPPDNTKHDLLKAFRDIRRTLTHRNE